MLYTLVVDDLNNTGAIAFSNNAPMLKPRKIPEYAFTKAGISVFSGVGVVDEEGLTGYWTVITVGLSPTIVIFLLLEGLVKLSSGL
jgi:hypothetical protein